MVRIAFHAHEVDATLAARHWLVEAVCRVGLNLMQVADRSDDQLEDIAALVDGRCIEVLFSADSFGRLYCS